ncbi:MAG: DNA translocase FtsK, partial [bacterium]|nr:DNA translocase FtsK [bacterium]
MAKKGKKTSGNKRKPKNEKVDLIPNISKETLNSILGIFSFVMTIFFLMAAFNKGGRVGGSIYGLFSYLFGIGFYLIPVVFFMLGVSFFKARERVVATVQAVGSVLFYFSTLGLIGLLFPTAGGIIGDLISRPLLKFFDLYASMLILVAMIVISILVIFDSTLKLDIVSLYTRLFRKNLSRDAVLPGEALAIERAVESMEKDKSDKPKEAVVASKKLFSKSEDSETFVPMQTRSVGKAWVPPPLSLLERDSGKPGVGDIKANANLIKRTLLNFGIVVEMDEISIGPSVTRYALKPAEGVKLSKILGLQNNLELALAAHPVRIEAPIPGKSLVGIEVPNTTKAMIGLGSLLSESEYAKSDKPLLVSLGRDISGASRFANIAKMPHCLIAGATGSGKSVTIHAIVNSLIYRNPPENLKFVMIDPKRVELTLYNKIPHLLTPVITDAKKAILALKWAGKEMDRRYDVLEKNTVRDIDSYHKNILLPKLKKLEGKVDVTVEETPDPMPYIVIIIDELADLMQAYPRELEASIIRLAQMSRAVGIHLLLSTQRPSVNVITGLIKANVPSRIALQVSSQIDSRTILDGAGAEKLLGAGDMLYQSGEMSKPERIQSAYISENEVKKVVKYLTDAYQDELNSGIDFSNTQNETAIFSATIGDDDKGGADDDELYEEAREIVMQAGKASTSYLQRKLRIGYARAARLIDLLEENGVIGPGSGAKPREVIGA